MGNGTRGGGQKTGKLPPARAATNRKTPPCCIWPPGMLTLRIKSDARPFVCLFLINRPNRVPAEPRLLSLVNSPSRRSKPVVRAKTRTTNRSSQIYTYFETFRRTANARRPSRDAIGISAFLPLYGTVDGLTREFETEPVCYVRFVYTLCSKRYVFCSREPPPGCVYGRTFWTRLGGA